MKKKRIKFILFILGTSILGIAISLSQHYHIVSFYSYIIANDTGSIHLTEQDKFFHQRLFDEANSGKSAIYLDEIFTFDWDEAYVFWRDVPTDKKTRELVETCNLEFIPHEDVRRVIFVKDGKLAYDYHFLLGQLDLSITSEFGYEKVEPVPRDNCKFIVYKYKNYSPPYYYFEYEKIE